MNMKGAKYTNESWIKMGTIHMSWQHVDVLKETFIQWEEVGPTCNIMVLLGWFYKARGLWRYKYDASY